MEDEPRSTGVNRAVKIAVKPLLTLKGPLYGYQSTSYKIISRIEYEPRLTAMNRAVIIAV